MNRNGRARRGLRLTFRVKLMFALFLMSITMILYVSFISFNLANDKVTDISMRLSESHAASARNALNDAQEELHSWTGRFLNIAALKTLSKLEAPDEDIIRRLEPRITSQIMAQIVNADAANVGFDFVAVYLKNGANFQPSQPYTLPFTDYEGCLNFFIDQGQDIAAERYDIAQWALCNTGGANHLVYIRFLYSPVSFKKVGVSVFGVREKWLNGICARYAQDACILTRDGIVLSSAAGDPVGSRPEQADELLSAILDADGTVASVTHKDTDGQRRIASFLPMKALDAYLVVPFEYYESIRHQEMTGYMRSVALMGIIGLIASFVVAVLLSRHLSHSIMALAAFTKNVENGAHGLRYESSDRDEIAYLGQRVNLMLDQLESSARQREEDMLTRQAMQLQLMQLQINPHLLYNTLNSVLWVLEQGRTEDAITLVRSMSGFFKLSLSHGAPIIPLSDELELVRHYQAIQRIARQNMLDIHFEVDEALLTHPIIKLSIQPLVENSQLHGFAGYRDNGEITIRAARRDGEIEIEVYDNGIGILPEELDELNAILKLDKLPEGCRHFGLFNVNRRIVETYGPGFGLHIESEVGEYTRILMRLPDIEPGDREADTHV